MPFKARCLRGAPERGPKGQVCSALGMGLALELGWGPPGLRGDNI